MPAELFQDCAAMVSRQDGLPAIVGINVGGHVIQVKRDLFLQLGDSKFSASEFDYDEAGNVFFDYSPSVMMPFIDWLRELRDTAPDHQASPPRVEERHRPAFAKMMATFSIHERHLRNAGVKVEDLRGAAGLGREKLAGMGIDARQLKSAGFSAKQLREMGYDASQLMGLGFEARELRGPGCGAKLLSEMGYPLGPLVDAGFTARELRDLGYDPVRDSCDRQQLMAGVRDYPHPRGARHCALDAWKLMDADGNLQTLTQKVAGYPCTPSNLPSTLRSAGYDAAQMRRAGYSLEDMWRNGYDLKELRDAGCSVEELTKDRLLQNRLEFPVDDLRQLRDAGYGARELVEAGIGLPKIRDAGYGAAELRGAGLGVQALVGAGYGLQQLQGAGYGAQELRSGGARGR